MRSSQPQIILFGRRHFCACWCLGFNQNLLRILPSLFTRTEVSRQRRYVPIERPKPRRMPLILRDVIELLVSDLPANEIAAQGGVQLLENRYARRRLYRSCLVQVDAHRPILTAMALAAGTPLPQT